MLKDFVAADRRLHPRRPRLRRRRCSAPRSSSLALRASRIDAGEAIAAARLDDLFQEERWGVDVETVGRTEALITDAIMLEAVVPRHSFLILVKAEEVTPRVLAPPHQGSKRESPLRQLPNN